MENENTEEVVVVEEQEEEIVEPQEEQEEDKDQKAERAQSQIDRLKKQLAEAKKGNSDKPETQSREMDLGLLERLDRNELRIEGVSDKEAQDWVIKFAKDADILPVDALKDGFVQDKLAYLKRQKEAKASTFSSPNRTGTKVDEVAKAVARYKKDGSLPDNNPALTSKVLDSLR
jgi:hypothetical protein